ncbi:MAG: hypothetical protein JWL89_249 [Candidatus Saccharibacteria bacterium]|nr:hypothetical protein [Candidatus Saccharibacteria bacterium]
MKSVEVSLANIVDLEEEAEITFAHINNYLLADEDEVVVFPHTKDNQKPVPDTLKPIQESLFVDEKVLSLRILQDHILIRHVAGQHSSIGARALRGLRNVVGSATQIHNTTPTQP